MSNFFDQFDSDITTTVQPPVVTTPTSTNFFDKFDDDEEQDNILKVSDVEPVVQNMEVGEYSANDLVDDKI